MSTLDAGTRVDTSQLASLASQLADLAQQQLLRTAIQELFPGRIALVSSFGADSAVLLHMISEINRATPVLFIDTLHLFEETLAYRDELIALLGLTNVKTIQPNAEALRTADPEKFLWASDPDACCHVRKVVPLSTSLTPYDAWISGRKRYQAETRTSLPLIEMEDLKFKLNPLATWTMDDVSAYLDAQHLPRHSLVAQGYPSIGCVACTSKVKPGEAPRSGRWRGQAKVECGIHLPNSLDSSEL